MAQNCSGARSASSRYEQERLQVLEALEETPMNRVAPQEDDTSAEDTLTDWQKALLDALEDQNNLLYDILGALNALTAAHLTLARQSGT